MKKIFYLFLALISFQNSLSAQNIPNASFDSIYIGGIDRMFQWVTSDGYKFMAGYTGDTINPLSPNTNYDASGFLFSELVEAIHPVYSAYSLSGVQLTSTPLQFKNNGEPFDHFIYNGEQITTNDEGYIDFNKGGTPFPYRPSKLVGYYKFIDTVSTIDNFGKCIILLKQFNTSLNKIDTIAYTESTTDFAPTSDWESFEIPINYLSEEIPDSITIVFFANTAAGEVTEFFLDELSFDLTPTSTTEVEEVEDLTIIYPNPNKGQISIKNHNDLFSHYQVLDIDGKLLQTGKFTAQVSILNDWNQALILQLITADGTIKSFKILKE